MIALYNIPLFFPTSRPHRSYFHFFNVSTRIAELSQSTHQPSFSIATSATFPISSQAAATTLNSIDYTNQTCFSSPFGLLPTQPLDEAIDPDPRTYPGIATVNAVRLHHRTRMRHHAQPPTVDYAPLLLLIPAHTWVPSSNAQTYIPLATDLRQ